MTFEARLETFYNSESLDSDSRPKYEILETHKCTDEEIKKFNEPSEA